MANTQPSPLLLLWPTSVTDYGPFAPGSCHSRTVLQQVLGRHHPDTEPASPAAPKWNPLPFPLTPLCCGLKMISDRTCQKAASWVSLGWGVLQRGLPWSVELHPSFQSSGSRAGYAEGFCFLAPWAGLQRLCMGGDLVVPASALLDCAPSLRSRIWVFARSAVTLELREPLEITWSRDFKTQDVAKEQGSNMEADPRGAVVNWRRAAVLQGRPSVARS